MIYRKIVYKILALILIISSYSCNNHITDAPTKENETTKKSPPIEPFYPIPSKSQLNWQNSEIVMFLHFGMNTFTDKEWGDGTENSQIFNPSNLDADQWVKIGKEIGFKYIILTAKHHDGFCLWPSQFTSHSVKNSPYKNGRGDIVKEFADACNKNGVNYCFYLSPWDRHEASYGTDAYNTYFQNQLMELLNNYSDVGEVWFDGANGEGPNGRLQIYNWDLFYETVKFYRPNALMAVSGPDIRWIGNENGLGSETEWSSQPRAFNFQNDFGSGKAWFPSECDVSIRPGWFYHESENYQIKSVDVLTDIYFKSVGRNSNLLLNVPPDKNGLISQYDIQRLREWKQHLDQIFAVDLFRGQPIICSNFRDNSENYSAANCLDNNINTFWTTDKNVLTADLTISLPQKTNINIIRLEEAIEFGQRVKSFSVFYDNNGTMEKIFDGTTIGRSRIIKINTINTNKIKITINDSYASPTLREIKAFYSEGVTPD
jgi:alpha-L-fucosidase